MGEGKRGRYKNEYQNISDECQQEIFQRMRLATDIRNDGKVHNCFDRFEE